MYRKLLLSVAFAGCLVWFGFFSPKQAAAYPEGCRVAFVASNGTQYISAIDGGGGDMYATGSGADSWETFTLRDAGSGRYYIQASSGHYWMANGGGGSWINAASNNRGAWETFELYELGGGYVAIQSINDYFVVAEGGGGYEMNANRGGIGAWETFYMEQISGCTPVDNAQYVTRSIPGTMAAGTAYTISVTMRNNGSTTWPAYSMIRLGDTCDCGTWGFGARVATSSNVAPGTNYTFSFNVVAPSTPGNYAMNFRMVHDGVHWFGDSVPSTTVSVVDSTPTINSVAINSASIKADDTTAYTITVVGTNPTGGANISHEYALINLQGGNASNYRGYVTWFWGTAGWVNEFACTGGGMAALQPGYGDSYIRLDACNTSVSGNTRTTVFTVRFRPAFTSPISDNDISGYVHDGPSGKNTGWINFDVNFRLAQQPTIGSATPNNSIFLTTANNLSLTANNFTNANRIRFYIWSDLGSGAYGNQDDIICPTFNVTETNASASQTFNVPLSGTNCWTGAAQSITDTGRIHIHVYAFNSVDQSAALGYDNFTRSNPGNVNINIPAGIGWTLTAPSGWTPATYTGTGPQTLNNLPYGSYTLTPAARPGYTSQVTPSTIQVLGN